MTVPGLGDVVRQASGITGPLYLGCGNRESVKTLQIALNLDNIFLRLTADGIFGHRTDAAVRGFQKANGLVVDGIVGPLTSAALDLPYIPMAPIPRLPTLPSRPGERPLPVDPAGDDDSHAIGDLVEAILNGMNAVHHAIVGALGVFADLAAPIVDAATSRFNMFVSVLRGIAARAKAGGTDSLGNIIGSAMRGYANAVQQALALPDLLGLSGIVDKIQRLLQKLQAAVNAIIDLVIGAISGAAHSLFDAISRIVSILIGVAQEVA